LEAVEGGEVVEEKLSVKVIVNVSWQGGGGEFKGEVGFGGFGVGDADFLEDADCLGG